MNKLTLAILLIGALSSSSCKKSSSSVTSIVGTWALSGVSGTSVYYNDSADGTTTTYSFGSNTVTSTVVNAVSGGATTTSTSGISFTTESWVFNSDGTYDIYETYTNGGSPVTITNSGTWDYLTNGKPNDGFEFNGNGPVSQVLEEAGINEAIYNIQSAGNTLVLTFTNAQTISTTGYNNSNQITLTFTKS